MNSQTTNNSNNVTTVFPIMPVLQSSNPASPYSGAPQVGSSAIVCVPALNEQAAVVKWDRPVHSWDFSLTQNSSTIYGYEVADNANFSYDPSTYTFTMPIIASAGLVSGTCTLSLEEPSEWG